MSSEIDYREEFLRAHYLLIADHATQLSRLRWTYVQLSMAGVAIFYSYLFGATTVFGRPPVLYWLLILPISLAVLGLIHAFATRRAINARNDVLLKIEKHHNFEGWAHCVDRGWNKGWKHPFDHLIYIYWLLLICFTAIFWISAYRGAFTIPSGV